MMDKKELAELYVSLVNEELSLKGKRDDDDDVIFHFDDFGTMFYSIDADDPEYMMLVFPNFANLESLSLTKAQLMHAINLVNGTNKAAKLFVPEVFLESTCDVSATIECFLAGDDQAPSPALLRATVRRNLSALLDGARNLLIEADKMKDKSRSEQEVTA
jgi:hypothetical protein